MSGLISSSGARPRPAVRNRAASGSLPAQHLVAELKRQLAEIGAHRLAGGDAEVREPVHVVEDVLARVVLRPARQVLHVADVGVRIDQRGDDRLAGQIDARRAGRRLHLALAADSREAAALDEEGGALNRRAVAAGNQPRAFVQHRIRRTWDLRGGRVNQQCRPNQQEERSRHVVHGRIVIEPGDEDRIAVPDVVFGFSRTSSARCSVRFQPDLSARIYDPLYRRLWAGPSIGLKRESR